MLLDLTCVDYPERAERFEMVYHLFSFTQNRRLRIKARLPEKQPAIDSLTSLWSNANWLEREVYDMFGVHFHGHPDLRRIFMYDSFEGFPLRKDYPLRKRQPLIPLRK
jgi:NADH-quinone oxidoreductase subunit C